MGAFATISAPGCHAAAWSLTPSNITILKDFTVVQSVMADAGYQVFWMLVPPIGSVQAAPCQLVPGVP